nr:hypothetical protein CFP56_28678 [Quercus suber]
MESAPALPTPKEPMSKRTPTMVASKNMADCIERSLLHGNHRIWGYTIYRCTYASDSDWEELLQRLRSKLEEGLRSFNGTDLMSSFDMKVFEDKTLFDGASATTIRKHFIKWPEMRRGRSRASLRIDRHGINSASKSDWTSYDLSSTITGMGRSVGLYAS